MSTMTPIEHAKATVEALEHELRRPSLGRMFDCISVPASLLQDAQSALVYALDEIEQLREDRSNAVKMAVKLSRYVADLEEELAECESADLRAEQALDLMLASR